MAASSPVTRLSIGCVCRTEFSSQSSSPCTRSRGAMGRGPGGHTAMPYAIEVDGNIITMFDPVNHEALETNDDVDSVVTGRGRDRRWVRIRRPVVMVGGELTLDMMELTFNPLTK